MAKRGETRPWRVRFTWEGAGIKGTETRGTEEEARYLIARLERTAEAREMALSWTLEHRTDAMDAKCQKCGSGPGVACNRGLYVYRPALRAHAGRGLERIDQGRVEA